MHAAACQAMQQAASMAAPQVLETIAAPTCIMDAQVVESRLPIDQVSDEPLMPVMAPTRKLAVQINQDTEESLPMQKSELH